MDRTEPNASWLDQKLQAARKLLSGKRQKAGRSRALCEPGASAWSANPMFYASTTPAGTPERSNRMHEEPERPGVSVQTSLSPRSSATQAVEAAVTDLYKRWKSRARPGSPASAMSPLEMLGHLDAAREAAEQRASLLGPAGSLRQGGSPARQRSSSLGHGLPTGLGNAQRRQSPQGGGTAATLSAAALGSARGARHLASHQAVDPRPATAAAPPDLEGEPSLAFMAGSGGGPGYARPGSAAGRRPEGHWRRGSSSAGTGLGSSSRQPPITVVSPFSHFSQVPLQPSDGGSRTLAAGTGPRPTEHGPQHRSVSTRSSAAVHASGSGGTGEGEHGHDSHEVFWDDFSDVSFCSEALHDEDGDVGLGSGHDGEAGSNAERRSGSSNRQGGAGRDPQYRNPLRRALQRSASARSTPAASPPGPSPSLLQQGQQQPPRPQQQQGAQQDWHMSPLHSAALLSTLQEHPHPSAAWLLPAHSSPAQPWHMGAGTPAGTQVIVPPEALLQGLAQSLPVQPGSGAAAGKGVGSFTRPKAASTGAASAAGAAAAAWPDLGLPLVGTVLATGTLEDLSLLLGQHAGVFAAVTATPSQGKGTNAGAVAPEGWDMLWAASGAAPEALMLAKARGRDQGREQQQQGLGAAADVDAAHAQTQAKVQQQQLRGPEGSLLKGDGERAARMAGSGDQHKQQAAMGPLQLDEQAGTLAQQYQPQAFARRGHNGEARVPAQATHYDQSHTWHEPARQRQSEGRSRSGTGTGRALARGVSWQQCEPLQEQRGSSDGTAHSAPPSRSGEPAARPPPSAASSWKSWTGSLERSVSETSGTGLPHSNASASAASRASSMTHGSGAAVEPAVATRPGPPIDEGVARPAGARSSRQPGDSGSGAHGALPPPAVSPPRPHTQLQSAPFPAAAGVRNAHSGHSERQPSSWSAEQWSPPHDMQRQRSPAREMRRQSPPGDMQRHTDNTRRQLPPGGMQRHAFEPTEAKLPTNGHTRQGAGPLLLASSSSSSRPERRSGPGHSSHNASPLPQRAHSPSRSPVPTSHRLGATWARSSAPVYMHAMLAGASAAAVPEAAGLRRLGGRPASAVAHGGAAPGAWNLVRSDGHATEVLKRPSRRRMTSEQPHAQEQQAAPAARSPRSGPPHQPQQQQYGRQRGDQQHPLPQQQQHASRPPRSVSPRVPGGRGRTSVLLDL